MKTIHRLPQKLHWARLVTRSSYAGMLLILLLSAISRGQPWTLLLFSLIPLLIFIPALRKESYKGLSLLCFVTLMYFMVTVVNLFRPDQFFLDFIELALEILLFNGAMLFSRWKQYSLYQSKQQGLRYE